MCVISRTLNIFYIELSTSVHQYDYDLLVIGGGSGGLACAKEGKVRPNKINSKYRGTSLRDSGG